MGKRLCINHLFVSRCPAASFFPLVVMTGAGAGLEKYREKHLIERASTGMTASWVLIVLFVCLSVGRLLRELV